MNGVRGHVARRGTGGACAAARRVYWGRASSAAARSAQEPLQGVS